MSNSNFGDTVKHESFGSITLSRMSSTHNHPLFGSDVQHSHTIALRVSRADLRRDSNRNWIHSREEIVAVEMSHAQFAEMITSAGLGDGTPVTITRIMGKSVESCPSTSVREKFSDEFRAKLDGLKELVEDVERQARAVLGASGAKKSDRDQLLQKIEQTARTVTCSLPFIAESFNEAAEKIVTAAKSEVEAHHMDRVMKLGIESSLAQQDPSGVLKALEDKNK